MAVAIVVLLVLQGLALILWTVSSLQVARGHYERAKREIHRYDVLIPVVEDMVRIEPEREETMQVAILEMRDERARAQELVAVGRPTLMSLLGAQVQMFKRPF